MMTDNSVIKIHLKNSAEACSSQLQIISQQQMFLSVI